MSQTHARGDDEGPERGPGQPPIGPVVKANLPPAMIEQLDRMVADGTADSRADAIRQLLAQGLEK
ncbi:ribbon-helix-helix domain-containing protein [Propionibacterium freudenreichii]|uniref:ribbon-helix-helix domain-containing protein n=1 Tax=Propionibacterium freudenreichii TaxID=1744 RepID=UPI0021A92719|nr:ribbon-helix-helix domain-containing protein [Propionibacterium freudenreichii]MCT2983690.1 ribbon-helix-helix protein, CopG family [Propionibacterium freudenreichii]